MAFKASVTTKRVKEKLNTRTCIPVCRADCCILAMRIEVCFWAKWLSSFAILLSTLDSPSSVSFFHLHISIASQQQISVLPARLAVSHQTQMLEDSHHSTQATS